VDTIGIAVCGCGTVGSGVVRVLTEQRERLTSRTGRQLQLRHVVVRQLDKPRPFRVPRELLSTDWRAAVRDPAVQVVVELIGGIEPARSLVLEALQAGKHVVTANKALLAHHGQEIYETARRNDRAVAFEASVAGGVPIIATLGQSLAANQILSIQAILNGTSNFILSAMDEHGWTYEAALAEAQRRGYAEADPTLDVDGSDATHKLAILAHIAFGVAVPFDAIDRQGIIGISELDLRFARELGYTIKLLAEGWLKDNTLALHVAPVLLRNSSPLARVSGAFNAIALVGDIVGETLYQGMGAGQMPTASAVVADIIDLAVGRAQRTFQSLRLWSATPPAITFCKAEMVSSRHYLRLLVRDEPGVLSDVTRMLAEEQISISSIIQHEALPEHDSAIVPLVIMTHAAPTYRFHRAAKRIDLLPSVTAKGVHYTVGD